MRTACDMWVNLASAGSRHRGSGAPTMYLQFLRTGLLVGLPDEPGTLVDAERGPDRFVMLETDAAGLGIDAADLSDGVALCHVDGTAGPWQCEALEIVIGDPANETYRPHRDHLETAHTPERRPSLANTSALPRLPRHPRMLVYLTADHLRDGWLGFAAAVAHAHNASVMLGAVGELPESASHAAEERGAIARELEEATQQFDGLPIGQCMELGGDPLHGLITLAAETRADAIIVPTGAVAAPDGRGLARTLEAQTGLPVISVAPPVHHQSTERDLRSDTAPPSLIRTPTEPMDGGYRMTIDGGWIELMSPGGDATLARAHLLLDGLPQREQPWHGRLESLHVTAPAVQLASGEYAIRFSHSFQGLLVSLEVTGTETVVHGPPGDLPAPVAELAEGE